MQKFKQIGIPTYTTLFFISFFVIIMDLPTKLEKLNFLHQKAFEHEEIKNAREDIVSLIKESSDSYVKCIRSSSEYLKINNTKKFNSLLSNTSNQRKLDIFDTFIKYSDVGSLNVNIPTTMVRNGNLPVSFLVQTIKNGKVIARPCNEEEYFNIETERFFEDNENTSLYVYKALNKEGDLIYSNDSAKSVWNSSKEPAKMQHCIQSLSNPPSIIRVLWVDGAKIKYFSIINHKKIKRAAKNETKPIAVDPNYNQKRRFSTFDYRTLLKKTSQSINNPFKVKSEKEPVLKSKQKRRSQSFSHSTPEEFYASLNPPKEAKNTLIGQLNKDNSNDFLVNSKKIENCFVVETKGQFSEINAMTAQIIEFLNRHPFKEDNVKGIVLDFIQNRDKKWFLLKCKEFSNGLNTNLSRFESLKTPEPKKACFRKQRTMSVDLSHLKVEESITEVPELESIRKLADSQSSLAGKYRNKSNKLIPLAEIPENEIFDKYSKLNEKPDKILNKEGEINANTILNEAKKCPFYSAGASPMSCQFSLSRSKNPLINKSTLEIDNSAKAKNPSFSNMVDTYAKNHINAVIDNLDEMNLNTQATKVRNENLVEKYGGKLFWDQFILSLYNKILESEFLSKYFKGAKLENFKMIVSGMFNLFNGTISPKFRRRVRAAHQSLGLSEKEFYNFSDIYENTLLEYQVNEFDKGIMMAQIKSLKTLIFKQGAA
ncbi:unnamed protein product [Blepharisma stoltei]|uniref:Globin family profile domain-containing protein n=1 Tax=Blepharisma stoltei TaxID=1481888 RepID=A0AAU9KAU9_9CILI|nr:unnamed protein product [Blepharisma stoltei]